MFDIYNKLLFSIQLKTVIMTYHIPRIKSSNNPGNTKSSVPASHLRPNICIDGIVVARRPEKKSLLSLFLFCYNLCDCSGY